jgi:hypothetical protein
MPLETCSAQKDCLLHPSGRIPGRKQDLSLYMKYAFQGKADLYSTIPGMYVKRIILRTGILVSMIQCMAAGISQQTVMINTAGKGSVFEGIGALSAGASTRLLIDYPEPYRSRILDLLFKPGYGASLQHLKVEIGGDVNSTCGSEPCVAHTREEFEDPEAKYYSRGYEFWLMQEACHRNPKMMLDVLQWGTPAWIGNGNFYSEDNIRFITRFIQMTKQVYGIDIHYAGIWNERNFLRDYPENAEFAIKLKREFQQLGIRTQLVGFDEPLKFNCVEAVVKDSALFDAIDILGTHYLCQSPAEYNGHLVQRTGKRVWSSEDGPWRGDWTGAKDLAKRCIRNFLDFKMTKTILWSLITSYYDILPLPGSGIMRANEPWSGHYETQPALWAVAHFTQFISPGWYYLNDACGYTAGKASSFTTLVSPGGTDISFILETVDARHDETLTLEIDPRFKNSEFYLWKSDSLQQFIRVGQLKPHDGKITCRFQKASLYTLTTTTGQNKGGVLSEIPEPAPFPLPYTDNFENYRDEMLPKYTQDQAGAFEVNTLQGNKMIKQAAPAIGNEWHFHLNPEPYTILGDMNMKDYEVSVDVQLGDSSQSASVYGRINKVSQTSVEPPMSYWTRMDATGKWIAGKTTDVVFRDWIDLDKIWPGASSYFPNHTRNFRVFSYDELTRLNTVVIDSLHGAAEVITKEPGRNSLRIMLGFDGSIIVFREQHLMEGQADFKMKDWNRLAMRFDGKRLSASLNGKPLYEISDNTFVSGMAGFGCGWHYACFDNLVISPVR